MNCPKCQNVMTKVDKDGIHIEQCGGCRGIFLDRGELEQIVKAEQAYYGGPGMPPPYNAAPPPGAPAGAPHAPPRPQTAPYGRGDSPRPYRGGHGDSPRPYQGGHYGDSPSPYRGGHGGYRDSPGPYGHGHGHRRKRGFLESLFD